MGPQIVYTVSMDDSGFEPKPGSRILVDTAPLIYLFKAEYAAACAGSAGTANGAAAPDSRRGAEAEAVFAWLRKSGAELCASILVWTELLAGEDARRDRALTGLIRRRLADSKFIRLIPVEVEIAELAAGLRPQFELADSIHIGTALSVDADAVLTNDEAWRGAAGLNKSTRDGRPHVIIFDEIAAELAGWRGDRP